MISIWLRAALAVLCLSVSEIGWTAPWSPGTIADWLCAGENERLRIASTLAVVAGHGTAEHDEQFFTRCIDELASDVRSSDRRLGEVAAGCTYMTRMVFAETD